MAVRCKISIAITCCLLRHMTWCLKDNRDETYIIPRPRFPQTDFWDWERRNQKAQEMSFYRHCFLCSNWIGCEEKESAFSVQLFPEYCPNEMVVSLPIRLDSGNILLNYPSSWCKWNEVDKHSRKTALLPSGVSFPNPRCLPGWCYMTSGTGSPRIPKAPSLTDNACKCFKM